MIQSCILPHEEVINKAMITQSEGSNVHTVVEKIETIPSSEQEYRQSSSLKGELLKDRGPVLSISRSLMPV